MAKSAIPWNRTKEMLWEIDSQPSESHTVRVTL